MEPDDVRSPADADGLERRVVRPDETHEVEVEDPDDGPPRITVPVSSTTPHRSEGRMTEEALTDMRDQFQSGLVGLWDDHGLDDMGMPTYPRSGIYGRWVDSTLDDGVLLATAELREGDERTRDLVDQLEQDMPVGFSVGYIAEKDEWVEREGEEIREILAVDLLETSAVGIPDNPAAITGDAARVARSIAEPLTDADVDVDPETASVIGEKVAEKLQTHGMTEETSDDDTTDEQPADGADADGDEEAADATDSADSADDVDQRQFNEEEVEEIIEIFDEVVATHMEAAREDLAEMLLDEDAATDGDENGDEDEESASAPTPETASGDLAELRSELEALRETNEELRAKVDRLESESRESAGRQGIVTTHDADVDADEANDEDQSGEGRTEPRDLYQEGEALR